MNFMNDIKIESKLYNQIHYICHISQEIQFIIKIKEI